ncbi:tyrosine-protein kinase RYK-like isoform X2 [Liolophura sinensis]|uniref:tyrosine-protein kinase RYK-like isoform X2 n=1 Tax=Liolophura sinensis TaxID=3198878 RepID=UPI0031589436
MDSVETYRLLGITAELYYVRNGIINNYALSFSLPIPADITDIYFTWQSLRQPPPAMYYSMAFSSSNLKAMAIPETNITLNGPVPTTLSVFQVKFPCTGKVTAEVDVRMQLNVSIFSTSNQTLLNFKRRKLCLKADEISIPATSGGVRSWPRGTANLPINDTFFYYDPQQAQNMSSSTHIFYIAVGCACAVILLIAMAVAVYYLNSQKSGMRGYTERMSETDSSQALSQQSQLLLHSDTPNNSTVAPTANGVIKKGYLHITDLKPTDVTAMLNEVHLERNKITLGEVLLEGTFGRIYHGTIVGEDENDLSAQQDVFIKTVIDQARPDQVQTFLTESCLFRGLAHQNLNTIIAACLDNEKQPMVIYPYANEGNLKKFLQKCRMSDTGAHQALSTPQLVYMAIQIIRGMQALHRKKIVHRDLATRNCVVDQHLTVRLMDNALSRDLFPQDYNCLGDNENRPVKWLSVEAILEKKFTPASDVWAFGVTLWELMTIGQQPYSEIDPFEITSYLQQGYRAAQPINCPDELFAVMACCWAMSPDERPKFSQLQTCLTDFYTALGRYI